jgi:hypothetical protein
MGMGMTSTSTQVTITGGVTTAPTQLLATQTRKIIAVSYQTCGIGNTTLYSVTAGKKLYITSLQIYTDSDAGGQIKLLTDGNAGAVLFAFGNRTGSAGYPVQNEATFPVPIEVSTAIVCNSTGVSISDFNFQGYEQ